MWQTKAKVAGLVSCRTFQYGPSVPSGLKTILKVALVLLWNLPRLLSCWRSWASSGSGGGGGGWGGAGGVSQPQLGGRRDRGGMIGRGCSLFWGAVWEGFFLLFFSFLFLVEIVRGKNFCFHSAAFSRSSSAWISWPMAGARPGGRTCLAVIWRPGRRRSPAPPPPPPPPPLFLSR